MWLPTPIYERVPQFWLLLGLLFMASGTYIGFDFAVSFLYFGVGLVCVLWSFCIFAMRARARSTQSSPIDRHDEPTEDAPEPESP